MIVRHLLLNITDGQTIMTFVEAKYILVTCVNEYHETNHSIPHSTLWQILQLDVFSDLSASLLGTLSIWPTLRYIHVLHD